MKMKAFYVGLISTVVASPSFSAPAVHCKLKKGVLTEAPAVGRGSGRIGPISDELVINPPETTPDAVVSIFEIAPLVEGDPNAAVLLNGADLSAPPRLLTGSSMFDLENDDQQNLELTDALGATYHLELTNHTDWSCGSRGACPSYFTLTMTGTNGSFKSYTCNKFLPGSTIRPL